MGRGVPHRSGTIRPCRGRAYRFTDRDSHIEDARQSGSPFGGRSVLLVEQNQSTRELMGRVLGSTYQVQVVATYEEAIERVRAQSHYDGVVVGLYPRDEKQGKEVLREIRAVDAHATTPVVAVCGPSYERSAEALLDEGFDEALRMPFSQSELLAVVDGIVGG